jgi:hypothetical protein
MDVLPLKLAGGSHIEMYLDYAPIGTDATMNSYTRSLSSCLVIQFRWLFLEND